MVDNDGGLKDLGSVVLGNPQHSNCHLRCLEKTGSADEVPVEKWWFKKLHKMDWMMKDVRLARVSSRVLQKLFKCKNARKRICVFLFGGCQKLGLQSRK